jgi:hypothetical protein
MSEAAQASAAKPNIGGDAEQYIEIYSIALFLEWNVNSTP